MAKIEVTAQANKSPRGYGVYRIKGGHQPLLLQFFEVTGRGKEAWEEKRMLAEEYAAKQTRRMRNMRNLRRLQWFSDNE